MVFFCGGFLKKAFNHFYTKDTVEWFEQRGVELKIEDDKRIFPISNNSQTIIDCLKSECDKHKVSIKYQNPVKNIKPLENGFMINNDVFVDKIIIASGGSPKIEGLQWLLDIGLEVEKVEPVKNELSDFIVAKIIKAVKHPNADRLKLCDVDTGATNTIKVVCGAPNAKDGLLTIYAPPGSTIPLSLIHI